MMEVKYLLGEVSILGRSKAGQNPFITPPEKLLELFGRLFAGKFSVYKLREFLLPSLTSASALSH